MKALVLFSGGLDSILAIKLLKEQGIKCIAYHFTSPFLLDNENIEKIAKKLDTEVIVEKADSEYFEMLRNPKHGYGSSVNPCIDCRIFILKKAKKIADKLKINIVATGEVLGERPMTQNKRSFELTEQESGLKGRILRPLSAQLLPKIQGIDLEFQAIEGRTRKKQLKLAKKFNLRTYPTPAGGCLLTQKEFAPRLKDLFKYSKKIVERDVELLKYGRQFRYKNSKIIVGRNKKDNENLIKLRKNEYIFEVLGYGSPITLLDGEDIEFAARLTARYSDNNSKKTTVNYGKQKPIKSIIVNPAKQEEIDKYIL